jgi:hypothetical protein
LLAAGVLFLSSEGRNAKHFDKRISLRAKDKIPYGTYVAYAGLKGIFPGATISTSRKEPGYWDSLSNYQSGQALVIITPDFNADRYEMKKLIQFIENGNDVFISTMSISSEAAQMMKCNSNSPEGMMFYFEDEEEYLDSLSVSLAQPPFRQPLSYSYPGKHYDFFFYKIDTNTTTVLGYDKSNHPNFIQQRAGRGNLFVHMAPLAFSNYFLLHGRNMAYYEQALSVISPGTFKVIWDEYFLAKRPKENKTKNWLSAFFQYRSLKWALLTALLTLLLYVLSEMRRKQRIIPVVQKPKNESLEFVKTIGRLYHDKGDHKNLCRKMAAYFLEHVRSHYKISTAELNEDFIKNLHAKSGVPGTDIREIVSFINVMNADEEISQRQLADFHKQLEYFYKNA